MMSSSSSSPYTYAPTPPPERRRRLAPLLVALAVVVVLALGAGAVALLTGGGDNAESAPDGQRRTAAELARKGLNCAQTEPVKTGVSPATERVKCATGGGSEAVVSTFENASVARKDAEAAMAKLSDGDRADRGIVVGSYWTVNCSLRQVCEGAKEFLDGEMLT